MSMTGTWSPASASTSSLVPTAATRPSSTRSASATGGSAIVTIRPTMTMLPVPGSRRGRRCRCEPSRRCRWTCAGTLGALALLGGDQAGSRATSTTQRGRTRAQSARACVARTPRAAHASGRCDRRAQGDVNVADPTMARISSTAASRGRSYRKYRPASMTVRTPVHVHDPQLVDLARALMVAPRPRLRVGAPGRDTWSSSQSPNTASSGTWRDDRLSPGTPVQGRPSTGRAGDRVLPGPDSATTSSSTVVAGTPGLVDDHRQGYRPYTYSGSAKSLRTTAAHPAPGRPRSHPSRGRPWRRSSRRGYPR